MRETGRSLGRQCGRFLAGASHRIAANGAGALTLEPAGAGAERAIAAWSRSSTTRWLLGRGSAYARAATPRADSRTTTARETDRGRGAVWPFAAIARKPLAGVRVSDTIANDSGAPRFVAHFDIDAFYASVAVRDDPALRGKPVAVAGSSRRAVVLTASYEARPFGVRSAMPLYKARSACPGLVVVAPDMSKYRAVRVKSLGFSAHAATLVEGLSMDEAFVDVGEVPFDAARSLAETIRRDVREATGLTVSAGVAAGKMIAKIASDVCKPDGMLAIAPGDEARFLAPLPVGRLWGIGPKTQARLNAFGIATIGDVAALDETGLPTCSDPGARRCAAWRGGSIRGGLSRSGKRSRFQPRKRLNTTSATSGN